MSDIHIPIGLCEITFGGEEIRYLADKAEFNAIPSYDKFKAGYFEKVYMLKDYAVTFEVSLAEESYKNIQMSAPFLKTGKFGLYDNPQHVNQQGKPLIIHPLDAGASKEYDIVIFNAIVDPENSYVRTYDKKQDSLSVRFLGLPSSTIGQGNFKSYFFIGDWEKEGVI